MKLGDPHESTAMEADHIFLIENIQPENIQPENIIMFRELTDLLWIWQNVIKVVSFKITFLAFHHGISYWKHYVIMDQPVSYVPKWPCFQNELEILLKSSI